MRSQFRVFLAGRVCVKDVGMAFKILLNSRRYVINIIILQFYSYITNGWVAQR